MPRQALPAVLSAPYMPPISSNKEQLLRALQETLSRIKVPTFDHNTPYLDTYMQGNTVITLYACGVLGPDRIELLYVTGWKYSRMYHCTTAQLPCKPSLIVTSVAQLLFLFMASPNRRTCNAISAAVLPDTLIEHCTLLNTVVYRFITLNCQPADWDKG